MGKYISFVFGVIVVAGSFYGIYRFFPPVGHPVDKYSEHIVIMFGIGVFFGAFMMLPTIVLAAMKSIIGVIGPYLPVIGGRRATDPPAPSADVITPKPPPGGPI
jgi:hypothetical protein